MSILNAPEGILKMLIRKYDLFDVEVSEDWEKRKETCEGCPSQFSKAVGLIGVDLPVKACRECGCLIEAKVLIKLESCPLGKWQ